MDLPVIPTPVFPRWIWMEEITYSHIPLATLITAFMVLGPIYETIGVLRKDPRWDRLAKGFNWFVMILFSPGAALGTGIVVFIIGAYPEFWSRWSNLFYWPLIVQFCFFLLEVAFLFFGVYLLWDKLMTRGKWLHIALGFTAAFWGVMVQVVWDSLGGYMMTPGGAALPGVDEPVGWSAKAFFNPSFPLLFAHRTFGNISYTMLLVGGVYAVKELRRRKSTDEKVRADGQYYGWAADLTFTIGLLAFFAQPVLGWIYAQVIHAHAPVAFGAIMGGHVGPHFTFKMGLILFFVTLSALYVAARHRRKAMTVVLSLGLLLPVLGILVHPPLKWFGSDAAWYVVSLAVAAAMIAGVWLARRYVDPQAGRWKWAMFVAAWAAFFTFTLGGFVRERSKSPDTVYGQIVKPEQTPMEADRYLTYAKCLGCHENSASFLKRYEKKDWPERVAVERARPGAPPMTDDEAERIVNYLQEAYP